MAKKQKRTANQIAFQKERKRLLQAKRRAEKRGYAFEEGVIPEIPKRVTKKALERIQATKPADLYKRATYTITTDIEGMEKITTTMSGEEGRAFEKQMASNKAKRTRERRKAELERQRQFEARIEEQEYQEEYYPTFSVIDRVRDAIINLSRETYSQIEISGRKNALLNILDDTVSYYEMHDALPVLEDYYLDYEEEIASLCNQISYDSDDRQGSKIGQSFVRLARLLNVTALTPSQAEGLSYMSEYNLDYND